MADIPQFGNLQPFPIASVIDAAQRNAALQQQALQYGQQNFIQGMQAIGQVGQSLLARKQAMAQALAQANIFSQTPEGKDVMGTNQVMTTPMGPVTNNQTANYDPATGTVTPNQSPVDMKTLQAAFMGEKPGNMLTNLQAQAANRRAYDLETMKENNSQSLAIKRLQAMKEMFTAGLGPKYAGIGQQDVSNIQTNISALEARKATLASALPGTFGTYMGNDKAKQARDEIAKIDAQISDYQDQLAKAKKTPPKNITQNASGGMTMTSPNGVTFTVNP